MAAFNKKEQEILDSAMIQEHPNLDLNFNKTGKVKDNNIRYSYYLTILYDVPWGIEPRFIYQSDECESLEDAINQAKERFSNYIDSGIYNERVYSEDGDKYICGKKIYGYGDSKKIYIEDGIQTKLYTYPNGDIAIFINDKKEIIANSLEMYQEFQKTETYQNNYTEKGNKGGCMVLLFFLIALIICLI